MKMRIRVTLHDEDEEVGHAEQPSSQSRAHAVVTPP